MAIGFVSGAYTDTGAAYATSLDAAAPAGISSGNLLFAAVFQGNGFGRNVTAPSGWALVDWNGGGGAGVGALYLFSKTATGSEPATYTFSFDNVTHAAAVVAQFSGATGVDPASVPVLFNNDHFADTTVAASSATAGAGNSAGYWVTGWGTFYGGTVSTPAGASLVAGGGILNTHGLYMFYTPLSSSGPTGVQTTTLTPGQESNSFSLVLGPPSAPSGVTGTASVALGPLVVAAATTFTAVPGTGAIALGPVTVAATNAGVPVYIYVGWIPHTNATGQPP